jgi:type IV pilus assembly protein PilQ
VDFRRGRTGEGRIMVDLSDNQVGIDLRTQGRSLIIDFINTAVPKNLARRLDVVDFGTPVESIETYAQGNGTRMVITPRGAWEHSAYQTDNRFIVEVKRVVDDGNRLVQPGFSGEKLSLNFQNVEVRAVLQVIADFTGLKRHRGRQPHAPPQGCALGPGTGYHSPEQGFGHAQNRQCGVDRTA